MWYNVMTQKVLSGFLCYILYGREDFEKYICRKKSVRDGITG